MAKTDKAQGTARSKKDVMALGNAMLDAVSAHTAITKAVDRLGLKVSTATLEQSCEKLFDEIKAALEAKN